VGRKSTGPLAVVRDVFEGNISRDDLIHRPPLTRVLVAVAVMLAFPEHYFKEGTRQLKGNIGLTLYDIIAAGKPAKVIERRQPVDYAKISDDASLHTVHGKGEGQIVVITPPPQLAALIADLGVTQAIQQFQVEVVTATAARRRSDESIALAMHPDEKAYVNWLIARVYEAGGLVLLELLHDAIHYELRRGK